MYGSAALSQALLAEKVCCLDMQQRQIEIRLQPMTVSTLA